MQESEGFSEIARVNKSVPFFQVPFFHFFHDMTGGRSAVDLIATDYAAYKNVFV